MATAAFAALQLGIMAITAIVAVAKTVTIYNVVVSLPNTAILDVLLNKIMIFCVNGDSWVYLCARDTFFLLVWLDFIVSVLTNLMAMDAGQNFIYLYFSKIMKYGFWFFVIRYWRELMTAIIDSFVKVGKIFNDLSVVNIMNPSKIVDLGFDCASTYLDALLAATQQSFPKVLMSLGFMWVIKIIICCFAWFMVFVAFGILAVNCFITVAEFYLCSTLMLIFIPFAVFDKTERFASQAGMLAVSAGARCMVLVSLVGLIQYIMQSIKGIFVFKDTPDIAMAVFAVGVAFLFAYLGCEVPALASTMTSGALNLSAHGAWMHAAGTYATVNSIGNSVNNLGQQVAGSAAKAADMGGSAYRAGGGFGSVAKAAGKGFVLGGNPESVSEVRRSFAGFPGYGKKSKK